MHALIIDDSKAMRAILSLILRGAGFTTMEAEHGREGLRRLQEVAKVDVALVDWNMPEMNGLEFVRAVRADQGFRDLRLMIVTAETEMARMTEALAEGADEYIFKPFNRDTILRKLEGLGFGATAR